MSEAVTHTWTLDERIDFWQRRKSVTRLFTPSERSLAWSLGAAWCFYYYQRELPAVFLEGSLECQSLDHGILRVMHLRDNGDGQPISHGTRR